MKGVTDKDDATNFKGNLGSWQFGNSVLFSVVRMIVLRQKTRHLKVQKNLKVSNFFKVMSSATSFTNILRAKKIEIVPRFPGFSVFKVSLCISHIDSYKTESCNQRSHLREVSRWNHVPRSHIASMANRITKRNADSRLEQSGKQHLL